MLAVLKPPLELHRLRSAQCSSLLPFAANPGDWHPVNVGHLYSCVVVIVPLMMPNCSCNTLTIGARQLVVQLALLITTLVVVVIVVIHANHKGAIIILPWGSDLLRTSF